MIRLIGLMGFAGSGKTVVSQHLAEAHGFTPIKFAGPLKSMMRALGLGDAEIEGHLKEVPCRLLNGRTPREAMQWLGTEWGRVYFGDDFWTRLAFERAAVTLDNGGRVVLDDTRFPNEVETIRAGGGSVFRIVRPGVGPVNAHSSDNYKIEPDAVIQNDGTLDDLKQSVDRLLT